MIRNDVIERECARAIKKDYFQISADGNRDEAQNVLFDNNKLLS